MAAFTKSVLLLFKGLAGKLTAIWLLLTHEVDRLLAGFLDDVGEAILPVLLRGLAKTPEAKRALLDTSRVVADALGDYWVGLGAVGALTGLVTVVMLVPLLVRAATMRRPPVFISYQGANEALSERLESALRAQSFKVQRWKMESKPSHQDIVRRVNDASRRAQAVVCLPGLGGSFVDSEANSATVAYKPVFFLVSVHGGSLPNNTDKRHPMFKRELVERADFAPLAELMHYVLQDLRSTWTLYVNATRHPFVAATFATVLMLLGLALVTLFGASLLHALGAARTVAPLPVGLQVTATQVALAHVSILLLAAAVLLPLAAYVVLVAINIRRQLKAHRRASVKTGETEFARDDWKELIPTMKPGGLLYESLFESAPLSHHERAAAA